MPYFVYRIREPRALELLDQRDRYPDARALVRELRAGLPPAEAGTVRMVFAGSTGEAEKLLSAPRDDRVIGDY